MNKLRSSIFTHHNYMIILHRNNLNYFDLLSSIQRLHISGKFSNWTINSKQTNKQTKKFNSIKDI